MSRAQRGAKSAFTRVFDALWRCAADPGPPHAMHSVLGDPGSALHHRVWQRLRDTNGMSIEDDIALLHSVPTLALLGREPLRILAIGAENRFVGEGEVLFREGDAADAGYVVQQGSFRLAAARPAGGERSAGPGTLLGEVALITATRRPLTATAEEPSSVIRIPRPLFLKMLEGYPELAHRLREAMAARTAQLVDELGFVRGLLHQEDG